MCDLSGKEEHAGGTRTPSINPTSWQSALGSSNATWREIQGSGQTGTSGSVGVSLTALSSQVRGPIYLSFFWQYGGSDMCRAVFIG